MKTILTISGISGLIVVLKGALAAHYYPEFLDTYSLDIIDTALVFQMFHTLAVIAFSLNSNNFLRFKNAAIFMLIGILLFSGSLYLLAFSAQLPAFIPGIAGPVTPIGGLFFLAGWFSFLFSVWKK